MINDENLENMFKRVEKLEAKAPETMKMKKKSSKKWMKTSKDTNSWAMLNFNHSGVLHTD